ncbi:MAG: TetR/AcrR family transcriptional regulator [Hyphomonas sp.]
MTNFPLRTKRKKETRRKLVAAARHLFLTKGYDNTTLDEIAERSGLHVQTLYRHFSSKQELAGAGDEYWFQLFKDAINDPERTSTTFEFWRGWMKMTVKELSKREDGKSNLYTAHLELHLSSPTILGQTMAVRAKYEDVLTEYLAKDFQMDGEGVSLPRLVAGMLLAGNGYVRGRYYREKGDIMGDTLKVIDEVTALFGSYVKS